MSLILFFARTNIWRGDCIAVVGDMDRLLLAGDPLTPMTTEEERWISPDIMKENDLKSDDET